MGELADGRVGVVELAGEFGQIGGGLVDVFEQAVDRSLAKSGTGRLEVACDGVDIRGDAVDVGYHRPEGCREFRELT